MLGERKMAGKGQKREYGTHLSIPRLPDSFRRYLYSEFWCQFRSDEEIDDFWVGLVGFPWIRGYIFDG